MLRLREFETIDIPISEIVRDGDLDLYPNIEGKDYFEVRLGKSTLRLQARGHIGVIPLNEHLTLEVVPRVPVGNLSRLLEISGSSPVPLAEAFHLYEAGDEIYASLAVYLAAALRSQIEAIGARGLLGDYERVEEVTSTPRGRVNVNRTIQRGLARGITHRAATSRFARSVDIAVNRCLLYAVYRLWLYASNIGSALRPEDRQRVERDLNAAQQLLTGVQLDWTESFLHDGWVSGSQRLPSLRGYYRPALDLALVIIGREALLMDHLGSTVRLPTLLLNMSFMFEAYLRQVLVIGVARRRLDIEVVDGKNFPPRGGKGYLFDDVESVTTTPDIVVREAGDDRHPVIVEVKYRPATGSPDRQDLNQAITYGLAHNSQHIVIAQPRSPDSVIAPGPHFVGTVAGMRVSQCIFNLAALDLEGEENRWVRTVEGMVAT